MAPGGRRQLGHRLRGAQPARGHGQGRQVQYSTVQYSTVQNSTVQYSTVQYSTVQTEPATGLLRSPLLKSEKAATTAIKLYVQGE